MSMSEVAGEIFIVHALGLHDVAEYFRHSPPPQKASVHVGKRKDQHTNIMVFTIIISNLKLNLYYFF